MHDKADIVTTKVNGPPKIKKTIINMMCIENRAIHSLEKQSMFTICFND